MLFDYVFERIPNASVCRIVCAVDLLLSVLNVGCLAHFYKSLDNKRLEELDCHLLRQTALVDLKAGTYNDNGTAGVVNTLTQEVLTEATLLTAKHLGEGLERTVGGACYGLAALAVIDERVYCLLQHSLFVSDDDLGSADLHQLLKTVVTADNATVKLVKVGGCKASTVQLYHRTDFGRKYGDSIQDHPIQMVARLTEGLNDLESLNHTRFLLTGCSVELFLKGFCQLFNIDALQEFLNCLGTHAGAELAAVKLAVFNILLFGKHQTLLEGGVTGIEDNVLCKIEHLLQGLGRHIQNQRHTRRNCLEIPDVRNRRCQLDVSHTFATNLFGCYVNAALFALDNLFAVRVLILTAHTSAIFAGTENTLAEQSTDLCLERSIVDGLGLVNLTVRPLTDHIRRR